MKHNEVSIRDLARIEVMNHLKDGNPDGDFVHSTIGAEDKILWWSKGYKTCQETHSITKDSVKPLQELLNEGYDPHDSAHHLQVQKMLKVIENYISNLKLDI